MAEVYFAIPGDLATPTGGYGYDRRVLEMLPARGLDVRHLQLPGSYPFASVPELGEAGYKLRNTPDDAVLLIDGLAYGALTDLVLKDVDRRIVALVHHPLALESGLSDRRRRALHYSEKTALARASHVVVTSSTTAGILVSDYEVPSGKITVAEPGTDRAPRARGSGKGNCLLAVGTISPRKGYGVLIEALSGLPPCEWRLTVVGALDRAPEEAVTISALVKAAGLGDRIEFKGVLSDAALEAAFDGADIFVMPSLFEGYGMVLGEAMARGLPIICTTGGAAARTAPSEAALKVPPGDVDALREAIARMLADATLRVQVSDASWAAGQNLPHWDHTADRIAEVLRSVISGASA